MSYTIYMYMQIINVHEYILHFHIYMYGGKLGTVCESIKCKQQSNKVASF